jgi:hypothetical protein
MWFKKKRKYLNKNRRLIHSAVMRGVKHAMLPYCPSLPVLMDKALLNSLTLWELRRR